MGEIVLGVEAVWTSDPNFVNLLNIILIVYSSRIFKKMGQAIGRN